MGLGGIHDLAYCVARIYGGTGSAMSGDTVAAIANFGAAAGKAMWYARNYIPKLAAKLKAHTTAGKWHATFIVDLCMIAVMIVDFFNGFNSPIKGESFDTGRFAFKNVQLNLQLANPDSGKWSGEDADKYKVVNDALKQLAIDMQNLDEKMKGQVNDQGGNVDFAHRNIALVSMGLVIAQGIALALFFIPAVGWKISYAWQAVVVAATMIGVTISETMVGVKQNFNGVKVDGLAEEYRAVTAAAAKLMVKPAGKVKVDAAEQTSVALAMSLPESMLAGPSDTRSVASWAEEAAPPEQRALLSALAGDGATTGAAATTGAGATLGNGEPGETPDEKPDQTPAFVPPTLAQLSAASGQLAKMSGHASQHMNLVNQTTGQVQQMAQMFQQGQGAAAPAEGAAAEEAALAGPAPAEAALAGDVEGAGAGVGAEAAERAPVEVAAVGAEPGTDEPRRFV
jgi:hypothetical protein